MSEAQILEAPVRLRARPPLADPKLAARMQEALFHAEHCLDQAYIAAAELTVMLPAMRAQTNVAFEVPQAAIEAGTLTIASLTKARNDLSEMHRKLATLRDQLRIPVTMDGPGVFKPPVP